MDPMKALNRGYYVAVVLAMVAFGGATYWLLDSRAAPNAWWHFFLAASSASSPRWPSSTSPSTTPSTSTGRSSPSPRPRKTGPATNIIAGHRRGLRVRWHARRW